MLVSVSLILSEVQYNYCTHFLYYERSVIMGLFDGFFENKKGRNRKGSGDKGGGKSHNDHKEKPHRQKETHTRSSPGRSSGSPAGFQPRISFTFYALNSNNSIPRKRLYQ